MDRASIVEAYRNRWTLFIHYGLRASILAATGYFAFRGDWASVFSTVLVFILMSAPSVLKYRYRFYLPFALDLGIVGFVTLSSGRKQLHSVHAMPEETHDPDETTIPIYKLSNIAEAHALNQCF